MKRKSRQVKEKIIMILLTICIMLWCAPKQDAMAQDPTDGQEETETLDVRKPTGLEELQVEIFEEEDFDGIEPADGEEDIDTYVIYSSDAADYWKSMGTDYIYSQLSAQEQKVWDTLETYCIRYAESDEDCNMIYPNVYLMDVSSEEATNFVHVFYYSHPQYFFLSNSIGLSSSGNQIRPILYIDEAFRDGVTRKAAVAEFKAKIDSWASEIRACDTDVAKEKKAIEILADNTIYSDESPLNQSAYSLVCEGKTVCAGYCATFAIVMNMAGVETQVITGNANGGHGWNTIKVHGVWYVVDPTWADQNDEQKPGYFYGIAYKYFNRSDATISADRTRYPMWEKYYKPANYDSGTSSLSYVDPYFTEGNYKYFTVNNNTNLAVLYALPIEALNGAAISAAPETILHESKTYNKYMLAQVWEEPKVTLCVGSDYDCSELLSEQKDAASWLTEDTTVATVNNGVVTAKASGTTKIIATVGTSQFSFEITVRNHDFAQPTFEWAEDGSSCKATRVCTYDEAHKESKDCTIRSIVLRQATCCAKGVTRYTANAYDINNRKDITDIEIDKNYHAGSTTKKNEKRPTCTEEGYTGDTYCSSCNEKISSGTSIPAIGHYMIREVSKKVEATCIAAGKEAVMGCARCEYTEGGATIEKKAHTWNAGEVTKTASCVEQGQKTYTCTVSGCGATKNEAIPIDKTCHVHTTIQNEAEASCTSEGWTGDTVCTDCKQTIKAGTKKPALGHSMTREVSKKVEATCIAAGKEAVMGCERCDYTEGGATIEKKAHTWNAGEVTKTASCVAQGQKTYTCTVSGCGATKNEAIPIDKTCHVHTTIQNEVEASCTSEGWTGETVCTDCKQTIKTGTKKPALGHNMTREVSKKVEATCIAAGKEAVMGCERCDYTEGGATIEKKAHTWNAGEVTKTASCVAQGQKTYTCTVSGCGATKNEAIPIDKTCHVHTTIQNEVEASCTSEGWTGDTVCTDCKQTIKTGTKKPALGHNMTREVSKKVEATCIAAGKEAVMGCERCDYTEGGEVIGVTDHKYENGMCIVCFATIVSGWTKDDTGWKYRKEDGTFITSAWKSDNGKWYYFNDNGYMVTGWQKLGTKWYYFTGSGAMVTGWQKLGTKWYYFTGSGAMVTGWQQIGGKWYFFTSSGAMATGWQLINSKWYYFETSGVMATGWKQVGTKWYYFETSGAMAVSKWINGTYYVKANGVMATNEWVDGGRYYVDGNGKWVKGKTR